MVMLEAIETGLTTSFWLIGNIVALHLIVRRKILDEYVSICWLGVWLFNSWVLTSWKMISCEIKFIFGSLIFLLPCFLVESKNSRRLWGQVKNRHGIYVVCKIVFGLKIFFNYLFIFNINILKLLKNIKKILI
jgi:hypothetical protein